MRRSSGGFGMAEVVVTIALLGFLSASLIGMFQAVLYLQSSARNQQAATLAAQKEIEELRNNNYNSLTAGSTIDFTSSLPAELPGPKSGSAVVSAPTADLKRVDVTVTYRQYGKDKSITVSSTIGIIGITQ